MEKEIAIFGNKEVRRVWHEEQWHFSVVDVISVLTDSVNPTDYLKKLRKRDGELGLYIGTNCPQVEMLTESGKKRKTLAGNLENIFRIIQSIPSKKAEPFKIWLAKVGQERIQEIQDPEKSLNRARENWQKHGRSQKWIQQRMMSQETRNKLTDYWSENGVKEGNEFAILTNIIHQEWSGLSVNEHKNLKGLKSQNLRDHMTEAELLFTALAELSTRKIAENTTSVGLEENKVSAKTGGTIAKNAKLELEEKTKQSVVSKTNFLGNKDRKTLKR